MEPKNKIILMIILVVICATLVSGVYLDFSNVHTVCKLYHSDLGYDDENDCLDNLEEGDLDAVNPREDDWYSVADWEIEYCRRKAPYDTANPFIADEGFPYLSQVAYSVVGEYTNMSNTVTGEPYYLYEVNYYLYPWDTDYTYGVRLTHSSKTETNPKYYHVIVAGITALTVDTPESGYVPVYLTEEYDLVEFGLQKSGETQMYVLTHTLVDSITGDQAAVDATGVSTDPAAAWNNWQ